jgi:hypothetical protein
MPTIAINQGDLGRPPARPKIGIRQLTVTISANRANQAALRERIVLLRA